MREAGHGDIPMSVRAIKEGAVKGGSGRRQMLDVRLPGLSGLDLQRRTTEVGMELPIISITGHGDIPMTVCAMKAGAVEFLTKPFRDQDLLDAIQQALERDRQARDQRRARVRKTPRPRFRSHAHQPEEFLPVYTDAS